jgi:hypothetical protein
MHRPLDEVLGFVPEFQELILIWHITTNVFLLCSDQQLIRKEDETVKAINALSNYMVFLVTVRPDMIPGLKLRSLCDVTRQVLKKIWTDESTRSSRTSPSGSNSREEELAALPASCEARRNRPAATGAKIIEVIFTAQAFFCRMELSSRRCYEHD